MRSDLVLAVAIGTRRRHLVPAGCRLAVQASRVLVRLLLVAHSAVDALVAMHVFSTHFVCRSGAELVTVANIAPF